MSLVASMRALVQEGLLGASVPVCFEEIFARLSASRAAMQKSNPRGLIESELAAKANYLYTFSV